MAQHQVAEHVFATQVEITVLKADVLIRLFVVMERRRFRLVEDLQLLRQHFNLAGTHVRIDGTLRASSHQALHSQYEFGSDAFSQAEYFGTIRVEDHLQQAFAIAQVDEDHTTVVATPVHPAAYLDFFAQQGLVDLTAIMTTHR